MTPGWCVRVSVFDDLVVSISERELCGRDLSEADKDLIRDCARHLLSFAGQAAGSATESLSEASPSPDRSAALRDSINSPALPREAGLGLTAAIAELERIERELSTPYARALQGEVKAVLGNWLTGLRSAIAAVRASAPTLKVTRRTRPDFHVEDEGASAPASRETTGWQDKSRAPKKQPLLGALIRDGKVWRVSDVIRNDLGFYTISGESCHWVTHAMPLPAAPPETGTP